MKTRILYFLLMSLFYFSSNLIFAQGSSPTTVEKEEVQTPSLPPPRLLEKNNGGSTYLLDVDGGFELAKFGGQSSATYLDFFTSNSPNYLATLELASNGNLTLRTTSSNTDGNLTFSGGGLNSNIYFGTGGGTTRMAINSIGNVGVGTSSPATKFHIYNGAGSGGGTYSGVIDAIIEDNDFAYLEFNASTYGGITFNDDNASIRAGFFFNYNNDQIMFKTGGVDSRMTINEAGGVGINTTNVPAAYKLAIDGKMICEEAWVKNSTNWPDYVFTSAYDLTPLGDLEQQIQQLGHLPNIPSASTVAEEGYALGDMQRRLLEKVEELTLYAIDADKRNQALETQLTETQNQLQVMQTQLLDVVKELNKLKE